MTTNGSWRDVDDEADLCDLSLSMVVFGRSVWIGQVFTQRTLSSSCGNYQVDVLCPPFGIMLKKITLHPANQQPALNICPWWRRGKIKSGRIMHKGSTQSTLHDAKSLQNLCLCVCSCDWGRFCFACACNWRSDIEQRLLNCSCQNFPQDNPLLPLTHASWICSSNLCQWFPHSQTQTTNIPLLLRAIGLLLVMQPGAFLVLLVSSLLT